MMKQILTCLLACSLVSTVVDIFLLSSTSFAALVKVELTAVETEIEVDRKGTKYKAWTFNGQFPGPVIRVKEGDQVQFVLKNLKENCRPHSMDFHAAETNFLENYRDINPGESLQYVWEAGPEYLPTTVGRFR